MEYNGFGNGSDGAVTLSGTDAPIDSSCSGTAGTTSLSATNASFTDDKIVFIHQSKGTGVGNWELNIIDSYSAGTITTLFDLVNTYTDSGNSQAQVIQLKEYSSVTVSGTFTAKAWDGNVGGILGFLCSGETNVSGTITAAGKGYRGASFVRNSDGKQGEGYDGSYNSVSNAANYSGGGGGWAGDNHGGFGGGGGAGGGHSSAGNNGGSGGTAGSGGTGGLIGQDSSTATKMHFGGGGGSGGEQYDQGQGGSGSPGGGLIFILTSCLVVTGSISANGQVGDDSDNGISDSGGGGGGAGGYIYIQSIDAVVGSNLVTATGGIGGQGTGTHGDGGNGAPGFIHIASCGITGSTNPTNSGTIGGHDYCQSFISIY